MTATPQLPAQHLPPQTDDPFGSGGLPSVSFRDAAPGTTRRLRVTAAPTFAHSRNFETKELAYWPDGNPKWAVVTECVDLDTGEACALWATKPSALFAAVQAAQNAAGAQVLPGGILEVTYTGTIPNEKNPHLNPIKQYAARYTPPNPFGNDQAAAPAPAAPVARPPLPVTPQQPWPPAQPVAPQQQAAAYAAQQAVQPPTVPTPQPAAPQAIPQQPQAAPGQFSDAQFAAMANAGIDIEALKAAMGQTPA